MHSKGKLTNRYFSENVGLFPSDVSECSGTVRKYSLWADNNIFTSRFCPLSLTHVATTCLTIIYFLQRKVHISENIIFFWKWRFLVFSNSVAVGNPSNETKLSLLNLLEKPPLVPQSTATSLERITWGAGSNSPDPHWNSLTLGWVQASSFI